MINPTRLVAAGLVALTMVLVAWSQQPDQDRPVVDPGIVGVTDFPAATNESDPRQLRQEAGDLNAAAQELQILKEYEETQYRQLKARAGQGGDLRQRELREIQHQAERVQQRDATASLFRQLADSMKREADARDQAAILQNRAEAQKAKGDLLAVNESVRQSQQLLAAAAFEVAERKLLQRLYDQDQRFRTDLQQLEARAEALRSDSRFAEASQVDLQIRQLVSGVRDLAPRSFADHPIDFRYTLKHAPASHVGELLTRLGHDLQYTVDERSNVIIVRGPRQAVYGISAAVGELDQPVDAHKVDPLSHNESQRSFDELRRRAERWEREARQIAVEVRSLPDETVAGRRQELEDAVRQAFQARQDLQRAELDLFAQRLQRIHAAIESRQRLADSIVNRRVAELLGGELDLPAPTGRILRRLDNQKVEVSLGSQDGILARDQLQVFVEQDRLGIVEIVEVLADRAIGRIQEEDSNKPVRKGDHVSRRPD